MKNEIVSISVEQIKKETDVMHEKIKNKHFFPLFNSLKGQYSIDLAKSSKPTIIVKQIHTIVDLNKIPNQPGFYLIFTDYKNGFKDINSCTAILNNNPNARVIYRGESYNARTRLESHLFNDTYHRNLKSAVNRNDNYKVCIKLSENENVNLDSPSRVTEASWYVAYHGMRKSNRTIREMAEEAFDDVFGKPIFSRDKK
ncbi:hypothetical protein [Psychrobacillus sp. NPDC096623]|uniref:hypothetical protein n=1 Tax=Psychrobacillus sp. NPDC096623 TaxID=3364492 RepID=UPI0037FC34C9